jgi:hypothetical protein
MLLLYLWTGQSGILKHLQNWNETFLISDHRACVTCLPGPTGMRTMLDNGESLSWDQAQRSGRIQCHTMYLFVRSTSRSGIVTDVAVDAETSSLIAEYAV